MTNKIAASDLFYELGSPSYGDSKLVKWKTMIKKMVFHSLSLVSGKWMQQSMVKFAARTNGK